MNDVLVDLRRSTRNVVDLRRDKIPIVFKTKYISNFPYVLTLFVDISTLRLYISIFSPPLSPLSLFQNYALKNPSPKSLSLFFFHLQHKYPKPPIKPNINTTNTNVPKPPPLLPAVQDSTLINVKPV